MASARKKASDGVNEPGAASEGGAAPTELTWPMAADLMCGAATFSTCWHACCSGAGVTGQLLARRAVARARLRCAGGDAKRRAAFFRIRGAKQDY